MYAKVYRALWDGTLGSSWAGWSLFVFLLAHADCEGFVDMHPSAIARRSGMSEEAVRGGLLILTSPDPQSRSAEHEGRRLEMIDSHRDWGWRIVNYEHYRTLVDADSVRAQARERQARRRARLALEPNGAVPMSQDVTLGHAPSRHVDVEVEVEAEESEDLLLIPSGAEQPASTGQSPASNPAESEPSLPVAGRSPRRGQQHPGPAEIGPYSLPTLAGGLWSPGEPQLARWRAAYPGTPLEPAFAGMRAWLGANRRRGKTARGMPRFVQNWLSGDARLGTSRPRVTRRPDPGYLERNRSALNTEGANE